MRRLPTIYFEWNYNPLNLRIGLLVSKESDSVLFWVFLPKVILWPSVKLNCSLWPGIVK